MRFIITTLMLLSCGLAAPAHAEEPAAPDRPTAVPEAVLTPPVGRLRFKGRGPVCMCADGLSERDIDKARRDAAASPTEQPLTRDTQQ